MSSLGVVFPLPKDGIVTPVSFTVRPRQLRGFLADLDAKEDSTRQLTAEWLVNRRLWRRMQKNHRDGHERSGLREKVVLYIHGGAYYIMSAATHRELTIRVSKATGMRVFSINYRLAPECKFPGALHDAVHCYFRLTEDLKIPAENIVIGGDSAGGGLTMALMLYLRDNNYPMPSGAILFSPWVDLTMSCDSWETNQAFDYLPAPAPEEALHPVRLYLAAEDLDLVTHPYASPLFGDMKGLPPILIQNGDAELLRDECALLSHKLAAAGGIVRHEVYEDCLHVFQAFYFLEAAAQAMESVSNFTKQVILKKSKTSQIKQGDVDGEIKDGAMNVMEDGQAMDNGATLTSGSSDVTSDYTSGEGSGDEIEVKRDSGMEVETPTGMTQEDKKREERQSTMEDLSADVAMYSDDDMISDGPERTAPTPIGLTPRQSPRATPKIGFKALTKQQSHSTEPNAEAMETSDAAFASEPPSAKPTGQYVASAIASAVGEAGEKTPSPRRTKHKTVNGSSRDGDAAGATSEDSPPKARPNLNSSHSHHNHHHGHHHHHHSNSQYQHDHVRRIDDYVPPEIKFRSESHPDLRSLLMSYQEKPRGHTTFFQYDAEGAISRSSSSASLSSKLAAANKQQQQHGEDEEATNGTSSGQAAPGAGRRASLGPSLGLTFGKR